MRNSILQIRSDLDELSHVRAEISSFIGDELKEIEKNRVILSIDEVIANIIIHGYDENHIHGGISIAINDTGNTFVFVIDDYAPLFNPLEKKSVNVEEYHDLGKSGGLGVDVFTRMMEITYEINAEGGNRLTLKKEKNHEKEI